MMAAMTAMGQQTVSVADARAKATAFLNRNAGAKGGTVTTDVQLAYTAQQGAETYYYVFNNGSDGKGGFVIIGGDETARTILGYSDNGTFDYATAPENLKWWLSQYEQQISAAIKNGGTTSAAKGGMGGVKSIARADIAPLCATTWDQVAPFNTAIPKILNNSYTTDGSLATGCVATAMAQIMKKYNYPTTGNGSNGYTLKWNNGTIQITFQADFANTTYDWANMNNSYNYNTFSGNEQGTGNNNERAVATLMYHCGVAANMRYGQISTGGSSASAFTAAQGMVNYFKYDKSISYKERPYYSDDDWEEMIYAELAADRPVLYSGSTSAGAGHAFVCDGYKYEDGNDLFYLNWGWHGSYNGYFPLQGTNALKPNGTGTGGGAADAAYDQSQSIVIGIKPDPGNSSSAKIEMTCDGYSLGSNATAAGSSNSLTFTKVTNTSIIASSQTVGVRLVNNESSSTDIEATTWDLGPNYYYTSNNMSFTVPTQMAPGEYTVYPIFKDENDQWQIMKLPDRYSSIPTMTVLAAGEGLIVDGTPTVSDDGYVTPTRGTYTIRLWNNSSSPQTNVSFRLWIYKLVNETQLKGIGLIDATESFIAQETKDIVFDFANYSYQYVTDGEAMTAGNTYYAIPHQGSTELTKEIDFQCTSKLDIAYKLSTIGWGTLCLPFNAEKPVGMTLYEVSSVNGNELVKTEATKIEMNKAYLVSGTAKTYDFSGPDTPTGQYTNGLLVGNTASGDVYVPAGSYVMQNLTSKSGLAFYKALTGNTQKCSQYKAYLKLPSGQSGLFSALLFTDGTTGIESIEATDSQQIIRKVVKNGRLTIETPQGTFSATGARMK